MTVGRKPDESILIFNTKYPAGASTGLEFFFIRQEKLQV
jgi:hypothetical protein